MPKPKSGGRWKASELKYPTLLNDAVHVSKAGREHSKSFRSDLCTWLANYSPRLLVLVILAQTLGLSELTRDSPYLRTLALFLQLLEILLEQTRHVTSGVLRIAAGSNKSCSMEGWTVFPDPKGPLGRAELETATAVMDESARTKIVVLDICADDKHQKPMGSRALGKVLKVCPEDCEDRRLAGPLVEKREQGGAELKVGDARWILNRKKAI
ncbi:unnamed protein product [Cutaneotrichosporon oleaginosum]